MASGQVSSAARGKETMKPISQREYARQRGVRHSAVQRAISEGRITTLPDGKIDPELADRQWAENTITPSGDGGTLLRARTVYMVSKARLADMQLKNLSGELIPKADVRVAAFNTARRIRDGCQNIPARCCGAIAAAIRRAVEEADLPANLVATLAAKLNLVEVDNILSTEIRAVLTELSDDLGASRRPDGQELEPE